MATPPQQMEEAQSSMQCTKGAVEQVCGELFVQAHGQKRHREEDYVWSLSSSCARYHFCLSYVVKDEESIFPYWQQVLMAAQASLALYLLNFVVPHADWIVLEVSNDVIQRIGKEWMCHCLWAILCMS